MVLLSYAYLACYILKKKMEQRLVDCILYTVDSLGKRAKKEQLLFVWPFIGPVIHSLFCDVLKWDFTVKAFISK